MTTPPPVATIPDEWVEVCYHLKGVPGLCDPKTCTRADCPLKNAAQKEAK